MFNKEFTRCNNLITKDLRVTLKGMSKGIAKGTLKGIDKGTLKGMVGSTWVEYGGEA
jgi:hypothetical protein